MNEQRGFTLVELLIASSVFAVVLLVITGGLLQIGRTYYKGVTSARTQEVARAVVDDIAQSLQFTGGTVIPTNATGAMNNGIVSGACVGSRRYSFALGRQLTSTSHNRFVVDTVSTGCATGLGGTKARSDTAVGSGMTGPLTGGGQELLGERMRLVDFQLTQDSDPLKSRMYHIKVRVAYGDDDLLCSPSIVGDCNVTGISPSVPAFRNDLICKTAKAGTQYCAVSEIVTTVVKRL